ncbi:MAG: hypothetical protein U1D32_04005 [Patescibacteria group bacterium]|nr:hypothetical protein [Patescibacteria group bacterium]
MCAGLPTRTSIRPQAFPFRYQLRTGYREPGKLFFSFVLMTSTYLVLLIALLLSVFSLPNDFKSKTIYTVVTKPVRAGDIVLGRIMGFTLVGTVLLSTSEQELKRGQSASA